MVPQFWSASDRCTRQIHVLWRTGNRKAGGTLFCSQGISQMATLALPLQNNSHAWHLVQSIYDVHTEGVRGSGSGGLMWTGGEGASPMWTSTQKIKIRVH